MTDTDRPWLLRNSNRAIALVQELDLTSASTTLPDRFQRAVKVNLIKLLDADHRQPEELRQAASFLLDCLIAAQHAEELLPYVDKDKKTKDTLALNFDYFGHVLMALKLVCFEQWQIGRERQRGQDALKWLDQVLQQHLGNEVAKTQGYTSFYEYWMDNPSL